MATDQARLNELANEAVEKIEALANEPDEFFALMDAAQNGQMKLALDILFDGDPDELYDAAGTGPEVIKWVKKVFSSPKVKRLLK